MPIARLSAEVQGLLRCPACRSALTASEQRLRCVNPVCGASFPIDSGVPILIDERRSVFSHDSRLAPGAVSAGNGSDGWRRRIWRLVPSASRNLSARRNYHALAERLLRSAPPRRVLIIGGATLGFGMESLTENAGLELVETDVTIGARTQLVCDAHDLPFADASFDAVVAQAVLEHVADPHRCVDEMHRILKAGGLVYAETPFMFPGHLGRYDFTRFTHLGHRRLFREFEEIDSGVAGGPGMALAHSYMAFLRSFSDARLWRSMALAFAWTTSFWLKYFDGYLSRRRGAIDGASGCFFMGRKGDRALPDHELIRLYRGAESP